MNLPPWITLLRLFHMSQAWVKKTSTSSKDNWFRRYSNKCSKSFWPVHSFCRILTLLAHTFCATAHSQSTWIVDSGHLQQIGHLLCDIILRLVRFNLVGRISWHTLYPNTLILFRILSFHKVAQTCFPYPPFELSAPFPTFKTCCATLYADLTVNLPFLLCSHVMKSTTLLRRRGILHIASASSLWNYAVTTSILHSCNSWSVRSATTQPSTSSLGGWSILCDGKLGIHLSPWTRIELTFLTL